MNGCGKKGLQFIFHGRGVLFVIEIQDTLLDQTQMNGFMVNKLPELVR
jgi:hypothetical protein